MCQKENEKNEKERKRGSTPGILKIYLCRGARQTR